MIITLILGILSVVFHAVFGVLPSLPAMPQEIQSGLDFIAQTVASGAWFLSYLYGAQLLVVIVTAVVVLLNFERVYHFIMFILKKIPMLNMK